ncbi:hypothetical protein [Streptomyces sp. MST-110588]|uniref:hypothetical protein n=1 Tax=Streptomyces sp. MST-110588 TaxID=2833628 RepID=UPI001F5C5B05|nr:hypothetical protein [Streptomyces sp. MST-110588]UNO40858.1 hypothetical protein KGS77_16330 [Streptomyces sp. MST-110588]
MASTRTRVFASLAALPLAAACFTGVAQADNGGYANHGSNASAAGVLGSGVADDNEGNSTTSQQSATGYGASNDSRIYNFNDVGFAYIDETTTTINFTTLW